MGQFLRLYRVIIYSKPRRDRQSAYFSYSSNAIDRKLDTKLKPRRTVPINTFLVPEPFPEVAMFKTAGTYNN